MEGFTNDQILHLFDYLKARGYIQGTEYLSSIEFGSEVVEGTGTVTVDAYKVSVQ